MKELVSGSYTGPPVVIDNPTILKQITSALEYLHSKEVYHRDLKPSNILISPPNGTLPPTMKLTNFAFTCVSKNSLPLWKQVKNKGWMAPEIYELETFTFAMDLFSLGLLFFYVLSGGTHAFGSTKEERIIYIKMRKAMTLTLEQLKDVPGAVGFFEIITLMLSFIPEERPSASAVLNQAFVPNVLLAPVQAAPVPLPVKEGINKFQLQKLQFTNYNFNRNFGQK